MTPLQTKIARQREHTVAQLPPIPDCDGVSDCYFSAAGELSREASLGGYVGGN